MIWIRGKRALALAGFALVLALFLFRPGADRLRGRVIRAISLSIGRRVDISSLSVHLLPRPGFNLANFTIYDDTTFGAEPMLRSSEVTAAIRISALLRGKLDIAQLSLAEPSLNLTRCGGHWNIESLVERASKTATSPTAAVTRATAAFPYIEGSNARINFKLCQEKKPYILADAQFAIWQDSDISWGMRLKAQPSRTDLNLSDTGLLRVNGAWQRAGNVRDTPFRFELGWERAQLGQASRLAYGIDKGWRGSLKLSTVLAGTARDLVLQADAAVDDFRRYDIPGGGALRLAMHCAAHFTLPTHTFSAIDCRAPLQTGSLRLQGSISDVLAPTAFDLRLGAQDVPLQSLIALVQHAKKNLPDDLVASGKLDASIQLRRLPEAPSGEVLADGEGETLGFELSSKSSNVHLALDRVPFVVAPGPESEALRRGHSNSSSLAETHEAYLDVGPFPVELGRPAPATGHARISASGYSLDLAGEAQLRRFMELARSIGVASPFTADGTTKFDVRMFGQWAGFAPARFTGSAQLRAVRAELPELNAPLEITSANVLFGLDKIEIQSLSTVMAGGSWHGSLSLPRHCALPCQVTVDVHADDISTDRLNSLLNPSLRRQPWYGFFDASSATAYANLKGLRVSGSITADRVVIRRLTATRVSSQFEWDDGKLSLTQLNGSLLGGIHTGEWEADFHSMPPKYTGSGAFVGIALGQFAQATRDGWITGTADGTYEASMSGLSLSELIASAKATLQVQARDGTLPHFTMPGFAAPVPMRELSGTFLLSKGQVQIQGGRLEISPRAYQLTGIASLDRKLRVQLLSEEAGFSVTGTLSQPKIAVIRERQSRASLKP